MSVRDIDIKIEYNKNVDLIMSPSELMENYLFGIPMCSNDGRKMSKSAIIKHILSAQTTIENLLNIKLNKQVIEENRDFIRQEFMSWGYIRTMYPIAYIDNLEGWINDVCQITYPREWLSIKKIESVAIYRNIYLIPNTGSKEGATMTQNSLIYNGISPHLGWFGQTFIPNYWHTRYVTGWDKIPSDLFDFVAKLAAVNVLSVIGDVLYGVGLTSISISLDGVSQNTPLTRSGQGGIFGGRIKTYIDDMDKMLPILKSKYRGISFEVV
jgi:hypothetical protein